MRDKVLMLVSGGPDGETAARLLEDQGLDVHRLHFETGFARTDHRAGLGAGTEVVPVRDDYFGRVVREPRYGYGAGLNACLDCRIFMLERAGQLAAERDIELVATGEVVGKRPVGQARDALRRTEVAAGLEGRVLRPLSARLLEPTRAEREGRVDRDRLRAIHGRSRRELRRLAGALGQRGPTTSAGGCCLLADRPFARRLRDWMVHRPATALPGPGDLELLGLGRHFRLGSDLKAIVARDRVESERLAGLSSARLAQVADRRGAVVFIEGRVQGDGRSRVAALAARYSTHREDGRVQVRFAGPGLDGLLSIRPATDDALDDWRL